MDINVLLFDNFEVLDVFGPVEILAKIKEYNLKYYSINGGNIKSAQDTIIVTEKIQAADKKRYPSNPRWERNTNSIK